MAVSSVHIELDRFFFATKDVTPDNCWEWFKSFRDTLLYKEYEKNPNPYALELLDETDSYSAYCAVVNIEGRVVAELERKGEEVTCEKVYNICVQKKGSDYIELKEREARYIELHPNASKWNGSERKGPKKQKAEQQKEQPAQKTKPEQGKEPKPDKKPVVPQCSPDEFGNSLTLTPTDESKKKISTQKPNEPEKHAVGEFGVVMLTVLEEIRLRETWEKEKMDFDMGISLLESYLLNNPKGKKYTSHAAVLRKGNWVWNQCLENMTKRERLRAASNSGKSFQQMEREREAEMIRGSGLLG